MAAEPDMICTSLSFELTRVKAFEEVRGVIDFLHAERIQCSLVPDENPREPAHLLVDLGEHNIDVLRAAKVLVRCAWLFNGTQGNASEFARSFPRLVGVEPG